MVVDQHRRACCEQGKPAKKSREGSLRDYAVPDPPAFVPPEGIEPSSMVPETIILSVELRRHLPCKGKIFLIHRKDYLQEESTLLDFLAKK